MGDRGVDFEAFKWALFLGSTGMVVGLIGWIAGKLHIRVDELEEDMMNFFKESERNYARKDDIEKRFDRIERRIDEMGNRLYDKMDQLLKSVR